GPRAPSRSAGRRDGIDGGVCRRLRAPRGRSIALLDGAFPSDAVRDDARYPHGTHRSRFGLGRGMVKGRMRTGSFTLLALVLGLSAATFGCNAIVGIEEGIPDPEPCSGNCPTGQDGGNECAECVRCALPWNFEDPSTHHCYRIAGTPQSWDTALEQC